MGRGGGRVQLTPEQALVVGAILGAIVLTVVVALLLEALVGRGAGWLLRLFGVRPPRKSAARMAIDELEARVRRGSDRGSD